MTGGGQPEGEFAVPVHDVGGRMSLAKGATTRRKMEASAPSMLVFETADCFKPDQRCGPAP
jgi:hypothetical protein